MPESAEPEREPEPELPPAVCVQDAATDGLQAEECPVCLQPGTPDYPLLMTTCGHGFCRGCIERVVMTTKSLNPTCAPCPVCRRELSLFDLQLPSGTKLHEKDTTCAALAGKVFVQLRTVGLASYHFPVVDADTGDEGTDAKLPYLCYESARVDEFGWKLDNGVRPPPRKFFEPGCHWHAATHTFHGTVLWEDAWDGSRRWDYVMQFSSEFRYICGGSVTMHKAEGAPMVSPFGPQGLSYVQWHASSEDEDGHADSPIVHHMDTLWGNTFVQGMRVGLASYHFMLAASQDAERGEQAYISYENPDCAQWPPLDDGSPVPARVPFTDVHWDESARTFRGSIRWRDTYGTSWQGVDCWDYTMVFDADYTCVLRGAVMSTVAGAGESHEQSKFGVSLIYLNAGVGSRFVDLLSRDMTSANSGQEQGLRLALMPGLGLEALMERAFQHFQQTGTPNSVAMRLLQLLPSAHADAAAQRAQVGSDDVDAPPVEAAERLLYTEEAIEEIDEAIAAEAEEEGDESLHETEPHGVGVGEGEEEELPRASAA